MSSKLAMFKARDIINALKNLEFIEVRTKGSHIFFKHPDGRFTLVPKHGGEDIGRGLMRQILREINMTPKDFIKYL